MKKDVVNVAKIGSRGGEVQNAQTQLHGRKGVCSLCDVRNVPTEEQNRVGSKPVKIITESFFRRPSLSDEALNGLVGLVKDGILVEQLPHYRAEADVGVLAFVGDRYRVIRAGDIVVLHFVDGMLLNPEELEPHPDRPAIGSAEYNRSESVEITELAEFGHGENTFLFCTRGFAEAMTEELLEDSLQRSVYTINEKHNVTAYDCKRWLKVLREICEEAGTGKEFTAMAVSMPAKRKRPGSKKKIILICVAVVALIAVFLVLGALKRGPGGGPGGPGGPGGGPGGPGGPQEGPGQMPPGVTDMMPGAPQPSEEAIPTDAPGGSKA